MNKDENNLIISGKTVINTNGICITDEKGDEVFKIDSQGKVFFLKERFGDWVFKITKEG